eukprot:SAG22_NODE_2856_length_2153_cov_1.616845_6_plen_83_part_01
MQHNTALVLPHRCLPTAYLSMFAVFLLPFLAVCLTRWTAVELLGFLAACLQHAFQHEEIESSNAMKAEAHERELAVAGSWHGV